MRTPLPYCACDLGRLTRAAIELWALDDFRYSVVASSSSGLGDYWVELEKLNLDPTSTWAEPLPTFRADATFKFSSNGCPSDCEEDTIYVSTARPKGQILLSLAQQEQMDIDQAMYIQQHSGSNSVREPRFQEKA
jgi:hypothetical protein